VPFFLHHQHSLFAFTGLIASCHRYHFSYAVKTVERTFPQAVPFSFLPIPCLNLLLLKFFKSFLTSADTTAVLSPCFFGCLFAFGHRCPVGLRARGGRACPRSAQRRALRVPGLSPWLLGPTVTHMMTAVLFTIIWKCLAASWHFLSKLSKLCEENLVLGEES